MQQCRSAPTHIAVPPLQPAPLQPIDPFNQPQQQALLRLTLRSASPMMPYSTSAMRSSLGKGTGASAAPAAAAASCTATTHRSGVVREGVCNQRYGLCTSRTPCRLLKQAKHYIHGGAHLQLLLQLGRQRHARVAPQQPEVDGALQGAQQALAQIEWPRLCMCHLPQADGALKGAVGGRVRLEGAGAQPAGSLLRLRDTRCPPC